MTRVAGVISAHNHERWVEPAVTSLAAEVDELVVVDDGSSDGTRAVIERVAERVPLTLIAHDAARGVSESYNEAVGATTADIVLVQGGDDRTLPGRRERSVAALADAGVALVYSLPIVVDAVDRVLPADAADEFLQGGPDGDPLPQLFNHANFICAPSVAVRRADYLAGGGFPSNIDGLQDYALWLELARVGRFHRVEEPLVEYRKHGTNLSRAGIGVDTSLGRRLAAETEWIRNHFLDRADQATLSRIAPTPSWPGAGPVTRDDQALLLRLSHHDPLLVRRGLHDLFTLLADEGDGVLARLGLDRAQIQQFTIRADHTGLAGLGRAAAVIRAAGIPASEQDGHVVPS